MKVSGAVLVKMDGLALCKETEELLKAVEVLTDDLIKEGFDQEEIKAFLIDKVEWQIGVVFKKEKQDET